MVLENSEALVVASRLLDRAAAELSNAGSARSVRILISEALEIVLENMDEAPTETESLAVGAAVRHLAHNVSMTDASDLSGLHECIQHLNNAIRDSKASSLKPVVPPGQSSAPRFGAP